MSWWPFASQAADKAECNHSRHDWGKWKSGRMIKHVDPTWDCNTGKALDEMLPHKTTVTQMRECRTCGLNEFKKTEL